MKTSTLFTMITIFLVGCGNPNNTGADITGIYVTYFQNEYTVTADTLIITAAVSTNETFNITRKTGFNKIRNGKTLTKEFKKATWITTYNIHKQLLQETELGRQIIVSADRRELKIGTSVYRKIK